MPPGKYEQQPDKYYNGIAKAPSSTPLKPGELEIDALADQIAELLLAHVLAVQEKKSKATHRKKTPENDAK